MTDKVSEKVMRETYVKAFGQEYDSPTRKQCPLPLEIAYKVALYNINHNKKEN